MTGRGYTESTVRSQGRLIQKFAYTALSATCQADATGQRPSRVPQLPGLVDLAGTRVPAA